MRYFYIFILLSVTCSCSYNDSKSYSHVSKNSIPESILTLMISEGIDSTLLYPQDCIILQDSILVVSENKSQNVFSYFKLPMPDRKGIYGNIGDGPEDFIFPRLVTEQYNPSSGITLSDGQRIHSLSYINNRFQEKDVTYLPSEIDLVNYILLNNDTTLIVSSSSIYQLNLYDKHNNDIEYLNVFVNKDFQDYDTFGVCMQIFDAVYASTGEYIAIGYKYWDAIDIYNTKTHEVKHLTFDDYDLNFRNKSFQSTNDFIRDKSRKLYFTKIIPFEDKFYLISWNGANMTDALAGTSTSIAIVITPDGEPIKTIKFNVPVSTIALDTHGDIRYAIGMSPVDYGIHIYEPSQI